MKHIISWRSNQEKVCEDIKWLDGMKMEELHAMDNSKGGVVHYIC